MTNPQPDSSSEETVSRRPHLDFIYNKIVAQIQYPQHAICSYLVTPLTLRYYRLFALVFLSITAGISLVSHIFAAGDDWDGVKYIVYFTNLNLYGLIAYLIMTLILTQKALKFGIANKPTVSKLTCIIHAMMYTFQCTFHPLVVIIYWAFLSKGFTNDRNNTRRFVSVSSHGITLLFVLGDIILGAMQINIWQIFPALVLIVLYGLWALVYYALSDVFVYDFLDFNRPEAASMYPGVLFGVVLFFLIMQRLHRIRDCIYKSKPLILPNQEPGST